MRNWGRSVVMLALLAATWSGQEVSGQSGQPRASSAQSSPSSGTRAGKSNAFRRKTAGEETGANETRRAAADALTPEGVTLTEACIAAVEELGAARRLVGLLERENGLLKDRLETEKRTVSLLAELNESRRAENEALRNAVTAKNETVHAKDAVIANQEKLIATLKNRKTSPWKRLGDVLIGLAAGAILR